MTIKTVKTWEGRKHCIVDENNNIVELKTSNGQFMRMAVFSHDSEGLDQARAILKQMK